MMSVQVHEAGGGPQAQSLEQQAALIAEVTQGLASTLNIQETLHNALHRIMKYLDAEACSIFMIDDECGELVCQDCAGPVDILGVRLGSDQGIVGESVQSNRSLMVRDARSEANFEETIDQDSGFKTRSILCAPLSVQGQCFGAVELLNKTSGDGLFDDHDRDLLTAMAAAAALAIHQARLAGRLVEQERVQRELELARQIQVKLLPERLAHGFPVAGINIPAREVSGDFYDFLQLPDGRIYFNLADVSGKGMNAAMLMAKTSSLLRCLAKETDDPAALMAQVNDEIFDTSTHGMFVTVVSGFLDPLSERVWFSNAGHQPPLFHAAEDAWSEFPAEAPPLGILPGVSFAVTELDLSDGALYLFTDGVTEQKGTDDEPIELEGLQRIIKGNQAADLQRRLDAIISEVLGAGAEQRDDITMMVLECG